MNIEKITEIVNFCKELRNSPFIRFESDAVYCLEQCMTIFDRSPFKKGDRVELTKTPEITEEKAYGWLGAKHFLVKGAKAIVHDVEFYNGTFSFLLAFDDSSWINSNDGKKYMHDKPPLYCFSEYSLKKCDDQIEAQQIVVP